MMGDSQNKGEIVIYQPDEITRLEVRVEGETVWLNRHQLASLFGRDVKTIGKHIKNALREELADIPVVANFATTASDGKTYDVEYYNLDMVLSIGYRVKSSRGIQFRKWANSTLREYLMKGFLINDRLSDLEGRVHARLLEHEKRLDEYGEKIDFFVRTSLRPVEGIFYDGQIFDAYVFVSDLVKSARRRIILIVDDDVYHIGASLKDLGKKLFAFSKMCLLPDMLL